MPQLQSHGHLLSAIVNEACRLKLGTRRDRLSLNQIRIPLNLAESKSEIIYLTIWPTINHQNLRGSTQVQCIVDAWYHVADRVDCLKCGGVEGLLYEWVGVLFVKNLY